MTNRWKALGLTLVITAATGALLASAAQAGSLDVGTQPAVITGHSDPKSGEPTKFQEMILTITDTKGNKFNSVCNTASAEGTTQGQVSITEATVTPTFGSSETAPTGCTLFGQSAQDRLNGCKFTLTGEGSPANTALVDMVGCTAGKKMEIKTALCSLDVGEQNGLSHLVAKNLAGGKEVTFEVTIAGITITQTGAACPDGNNHVSNGVSLTGNTLLKAFKTSGTKQVTKHGHQYAELLCGEQVTMAST